MASQTAKQTPSLPSTFGGRVAAASAASSNANKSFTAAVFARIFTSKPEKTLRKLVKKRSVANLAASAPVPSAFERQAAGIASREPAHELELSSRVKPLPKEPQAKLSISSRSACCDLDVNPAHSSSRQPASSRDQMPNQWRPDSMSSIEQADHGHNQHVRRAANNNYSLLSAPAQLQQSRTPKSSRFSPAFSSPSTPARPSPLRSSPCVATTTAPGPVSVNRGTRSVQQIMGRRYTTKLGRMSILPALPELSEEEQAFTRALNSPITALRYPVSRPTAPVNLPDVQRSQSQQLKARNDLVEFANELRADNAQLSVHLQDTVSQKIVATTQLEQQKKDYLVLEESLQALWALVQPDIILDTAQICQQVKLLSTSSQSQTSAITTTKDTQDMASLERKLDQQTQQLSSYRCSEAVSRQLTHTLVHENKQMKVRSDKVEAERLRLQTSLHVAEAKLERIERSLYVYPSSAQEILSGTATLLDRK